MKALIESIKVKNNKIHNLTYHQARIAKSLNSIYGSSALLDFSGIENKIKEIDSNTYKLRIVYNNLYFKYQLIPYTLKPIKALRIIHSNTISYSHKYEDRTPLAKLYERKRGADDILIIKNGLITDSYYCNIAIHIDNQWLTPITPLLLGTKRQQLIDGNHITPTLLSVEDIKRSNRVRLFNAMIEFGEVELRVEQVY